MQPASARDREAEPFVSFRIITVPLIHNDGGQYLICKMATDRGVFPGKWGLPGGGLEKGERAEDGLRRDIREELGIEVRNLKRLFFKDGQFLKSFADRSKGEVYMIFLIFSCQPVERIKTKS
jgi:nucleoside triphosphatase